MPPADSTISAHNGAGSEPDATLTTSAPGGDARGREHTCSMQSRMVDLITQHPGVAQAAIVQACDGGEVRPVAYFTPHPQHAAAVARLLEYRSRGLLAKQKQTTLPDGTIIVHHNKGETDFVYTEIFDDNCYLKHGITVREGDCVFDVGANIGLFSLYLSGLPCAVNVFAFEPLPPTHLRLETNRAICGMQNVRTFSVGLSSKASVETFTYYARNSIMSGRYADTGEDSDVVRRFLLRQREAAGMTDKPSDMLLNDIVKNSLAAEHFDCELRTLSEVMAEHRIERIDLLKIDVEKSELDVLKGIREDDWPKIMQLVVEVYDGAGQLAVVDRLLRGHGFQVVVEQDANLRDTHVHMVYATRTHCGRGCDDRASRPSSDVAPWRNNPVLLAEDVRRQVLAQVPEGTELPRFEVVHALPDCGSRVVRQPV
jgi:FkbM family methyltransferase